MRLVCSLLQAYQYRYRSPEGPMVGKTARKQLRWRRHLGIPGAHPDASDTLDALPGGG